MMETLSLQSQSIDEINWDDPVNDLKRKRCVLFLGPSLPLYTFEDEKLDFYTLASLHLAKLLKDALVDFDPDQSQNLYYTTQKFISFKKNYRTRMEDEIADLYRMQIEKLKDESSLSIPALYRHIHKLPWHTIVNTQPDNFFENVMGSNEVFAFYHYRNKENEMKKLDEDQFLVYNLFGAIIKEKSDYRVDSLILTEEDQVEFVRNLVRECPGVPESVLSRFDNNKTYIFLDCNLENWHFRLLLETLKIHKESHTFSSKSCMLNFSPLTVEFYKKRYGFVFINNNSEEFITELLIRYQPPSQPLHEQKKIFMAYHDADENIAQSLISQFEPWVVRNELKIWSKENLSPADPVKIEQDEFDTADSIVLLVSAKLLNEPTYSSYVKPALEKAFSTPNPKKVFAVIDSSCPWEETPIKELHQKNILPTNHIPIKLQLEQDPNKILYEIANSITKALWE